MQLKNHREEVLKRFGGHFVHSECCLGQRFRDIEAHRNEECYCDIKEIKQFLTQTIQDILEEVVGEVKEDETGEPRVDDYRYGYNEAKQEIHDRIQQLSWGKE